MPEGPEIRQAADRVASAIEGQVARRVEFGLPHLARYGEQLSGHTVTAVETRGKAMITRFDCGLAVYSHNQLYGRWFVVAAGKPPSTRRSLRFAVHAQQRWALLYSASEIEVLDQAALDRHPFLSRLGPDALDPEVTESVIRRRLERDEFRRRRLAGVLLDQGFVAGLGNYLRAEILFFAGVHPALRADDLDARQRRRLARAIIRITRRSYETGGLTDLPRRVARARRAGRSRREYRHAVFSRDGQPCRACEHAIQRDELAGRRIYFCPRCQPLATARGHVLGVSES